jgi:hypothetical protein
MDHSNACSTTNNPCHHPAEDEAKYGGLVGLLAWVSDLPAD